MDREYVLKVSQICEELENSEPDLICCEDPDEIIGCAYRNGIFQKQDWEKLDD